MIETPKNRRRWPRKTLTPPEIAILCAEDKSDPAVKKPLGRLFVDLLNKAQGGVLLKTPKKIEPYTGFQLQIYNTADRSWDSSPAEVKWISEDLTRPGYHLMGVAFQQQDRRIKPSLYEAEEPVKQKPLPSDYQFFRGVPLLKLMHRDAVCPVLNSVIHKPVKAGERFITQGDAGDTFYVIQRGSCNVNVEIDGKLHRVAQHREGDVVGEMAILTGEPRSAHVEAETDMELWGLSSADFDEISSEYPELRNFMTEVVAERFESSKKTAERKIGKYLITDIIGRGGYSIVYKGVHTDLNMPVAIKMMRHDMAMNSDFWDNFKMEAQIIAQFNHENIVRVYDIEELYRTIFIIMEFMEGETLPDLLRRLGVIPPIRAIHFLFQICYGLDYAHKQNIIHQDLKAENIFVLEGDRVKILDFGLACPIGSEDRQFESTVFYMSPEQIECGALDQRTDIYALGITAFEMVTGKRPYPEDDLLALEDMHLNQDIPDPADLVPDLPGPLRKFIIKCCRRDADQRYQNIGQALEDLQPLIRELGPARKEPSAEKRKMATLFLFYKDEHQLTLNKLMDEFCTKVKKLGVDLKAGDFKDV